MKEDYEWEYLARSLNDLVEWVESICTDDQLDTPMLSRGGGTGRELLVRIKAGPGDADRYSAWKRKVHQPGRDLRDGLDIRVTRDQPVADVGDEPVEPALNPKSTPTVTRPALQPGTVLVYRIRQDDTAVVIALERDARHVDAIRRATETARTWGEFRAMLPDGEWSAIWDSWSLDGSQWDTPIGEVDELPPSLADGQPFDSDALPGYVDGDYPDWLQQKMLDILPEDFLQKYGRVELSMLNGGFCVIDAGSLDDVLRDLEGRGFIVKDGSDLNFY